MNVTSFLERWNRLGKQRQLLHILMCLIKSSPIKDTRIPLTDLDSISSGESILLVVEGDNLVVRYAPEQVELLTIQDGGNSWGSGRSPSPYANSQDSPQPTGGIRREGQTLSDLQAVVAEERQKKAQETRKAVSRIRSKGLENLTDDLPPLT